jgi:Fic family protein
MPLRVSGAHNGLVAGSSPAGPTSLRSSQIRIERNAYYEILERTQKNSLDITPWLAWFLACLDRALDGAEKTLKDVLDKAAFWKKHAQSQINIRQRDMINRLLDGFDGNLTSSKWAIIEKCSPDTALRDISELLEAGILRKDAGGGRSTSYSLASSRSAPEPKMK